MKEITYYLANVKGENWKLMSEVQTDFGGPAVNFICEGTKEYCEKQMEFLKNNLK